MTFRELEIAEPILKAICEKGYEKPTPIQEWRHISRKAVVKVLHGCRQLVP